MPDRMIRDEILGSDRWLSLPRNTHRLAFIACILVADDNGNFEASDGALIRLWRDFGIETKAAALEVLECLVACGLLITYPQDDHGKPKRFAHVPNFRQRVRYPRAGCPLAPWQNDSNINTNQSKKSDHGPTEVSPKTVSSLTEVGQREVKRSEVKRSEVDLRLPITTQEAVDNLARKLKNGINPNGQKPDQPEPPWNRFRIGIDAKCDELGVPHHATDSDEFLVKACNVAMAKAKAGVA